LDNALTETNLPSPLIFFNCHFINRRNFDASADAGTGSVPKCAKPQSSQFGSLAFQNFSKLKPTQNSKS
jgi:hypothetical protein